MFKRFIPTWKIESIYDLTPQEVKNHGIKAILTDLDNTLIAWNNPDGTPELRNWLKVMREESIPVIVVSNNNHRRIKRAVERFELPFVSRALKPFVRGINIAKKRYNLKSDEISAKVSLKKLSIPLVGSSNSRSLGFVSSTFARAARCCSPPDRS